MLLNTRLIDLEQLGGETGPDAISQLMLLCLPFLLLVVFKDSFVHRAISKVVNVRELLRRRLIL